MTNVRKMIITSMKMIWTISESINEFNAQNPMWFELLVLIIAAKLSMSIVRDLIK